MKRILFCMLLFFMSQKAYCLSDLILESLTYTPSTGVWSGVVKNIGADRTPTGTAIGVGWNVNGVKVGYSIRGFASSGLAAGSKFTFNFSHPMGDLSSTSYDLSGLVDDVNRIVESNEGNNLTNINVGNANVAPDLIITNFTYEDGVYIATVKNNGNAATPPSKNIGLAYFVDGVFKTWGSSQFTDGFFPPLAAGASVIVGTEKEGVDSGGTYIIPDGTHSVKAKVDGSNVIEESNEANNESTIEVVNGDSEDPSVPTGLVATPISDTQINLSWNASTDNVGVTNYNVFRNGVQIASPTGTTYNNTGLTENTTYTYKLTSEDAASNESVLTAGVKATTTTTVSQPVNVSSAPAAIAGSNTIDIRYTQTLPKPTGTGTASSGKIRIRCKVAKVGFIDPIVYPGQAGNTGHLHTFLGNDSVTNFSTATSMQNVGGSTCVGGAANKSGYWVPTMYDKRDGRVVPLTQGLLYYASVPLADVRLSIQKLPNGLKMIAGNKDASAPGGFEGYFECLSYSGGGAYNQGSSIPTCQDNHVVRWKIGFPECWDGKRLDSPNHKDHMSEPEGGDGNGCPSTHPIRMPSISFIFDYKLQAANESQYWRFSSDMYNINSPGGYSGHGDVFEAWDDNTIDLIVKNCIKPAKDCGGTILGDHKEMYFK